MLYVSDKILFSFPQSFVIMNLCVKCEGVKKYDGSQASRTCPDEFGRPRTFHYALTVDTVESDTFSCENYGVRISEESGDTAAIPGITTSAVRIDELLTLLVEHGVSPTALPDVISDWL